MPKLINVEAFMDLQEQQDTRSKVRSFKKVHKAKRKGKEDHAVTSQKGREKVAAGQENWLCGTRICLQTEGV